MHILLDYSNEQKLIQCDIKIKQVRQVRFHANVTVLQQTPILTDMIISETLNQAGCFSDTQNITFPGQKKLLTVANMSGFTT